ncbi:MAG: O-antigen ligase family protein [Armatimonadota bacterium]
MAIATGLYLAALVLITLFTDVIFGVSAQSLAYGPISLALVVLLYLGMTDRPRDFLDRWYSSSPLAAAGLLFLAGLAAALPNARDLGLAARDLLRWSFVWLVFAPVTRALCDSPQRCRLFARTAAALIVGFAAFTVADLLTGAAVTSALVGRAGVSPEGRFWSLYGNAGVLAGMLIVGLPLALVPALTDGRAWGRWAWGLATLLLITAMLLSGSRAALAAGAVAVSTVALALRRWWLLGVVVGTAASVALLLGTRPLQGPPGLVRLQQLATHSGPGMHSLQRRELIWSVAAHLLQRSPLIGLGGSQLRFHQHAGFRRAHNAWLDAWLDGGLPALLAMLVVTWRILRRAGATVRGQCARYRDPTHAALVAACLAVLVGWLVRAGIGGRIDWLPVFMLFGLWWERPACERPPMGGAEGKRCSGGAQGRWDSEVPR